MKLALPGRAPGRRREIKFKILVAVCHPGSFRPGLVPGPDQVVSICKCLLTTQPWPEAVSDAVPLELAVPGQCPGPGPQVAI